MNDYIFYVFFVGAGMKTGLDRLFEHIEELSGKVVGVCCNHTAIDQHGNHLLDLLAEHNVPVRRIFGPEHGIDATAQDMISVDEAGYEMTIETVSLYGETEDSLHPKLETLEDLDVLLFDIQDIGSRYYTYQASLGYIMEIAAQTNTEIWVLDRPNPINGVDVRGNIVHKGFESFVSAYPIPTQHGMTMGELGLFFKRFCGHDCPLRIWEMDVWDRATFYDETPLPWIYPSPNMPMVETAVIYPGMCLIEGTNISEGRGTTRPFHLFGAPWVNKQNLLSIIRTISQDNGLIGCIFRAATFEPRFQKHAGEVCHGVEIIITDRTALDPLLLGIVCLEALIKENSEQFEWRTETYEYVDDPIAIDLLFGCSEIREGLEQGVGSAELLAQMNVELPVFMEQRSTCLLY